MSCAIFLRCCFNLFALFSLLLIFFSYFFPFVFIFFFFPHWEARTSSGNLLFYFSSFLLVLFLLFLYCLFLVFPTVVIPVKVSNPIVSFLEKRWRSIWKIFCHVIKIIPKPSFLYTLQRFLQCASQLLWPLQNVLTWTQTFCAIMMRDELRLAAARGFICSLWILDWLFLMFFLCVCNFVDLSLEIDSIAWNFNVLNALES